MDNSGTIKTVIAVIAGIAVVVWLQLSVFGKENAFASSDDTSSALSTLSKLDDGPDGVLKLMASEVNKKCPMKVDDETQLDKAEAMPGNGFAYDYTLINKEASQIDTAAFRQRMAPLILNNLKTNVAFQYLREKKVTMIFNYSDKNGVLLLSMAFDADEY
jgi:hypothetical protein